MAKIVFICPAQPSRTPRLVRNATALHSVGHDVVVISPVLEPNLSPEDHKIVNRCGWTYRPILLGASGPAQTLAFRYRFKRRLLYEIASRFKMPRLGSIGLVYGVDRIRNAADTDADLFIAQQQSAVPLAASIAKRRGKPFACDIEDILSESQSEPKNLYRAIESKIVTSANAVFTMSEAAAEFLCQQYSFKRNVIALHNCPALTERQRGEASSELRRSKAATIYWFGQTLGPHSCVFELLQANVAAGCPFEIFVRGRPVASYVEKLTSYSKGKGVHLHILPVVSPEDMVSECAQFDILFGSQPSDQLFHQLAIGNKVFTGLMGGCALLLENTIAHRRLLPGISDCAELFAFRDQSQLISILQQLAGDKNALVRRRQMAWAVATSVFNWEKESQKLINSVDSILAESKGHVS